MYPDTYDLNFEDSGTVAFFSLPYEVFNNWSAHSVTIWNRTFPTAEHAYQYAKFSDADPAVAQQIASAISPWLAFQLSRKHRNLTPASWNEKKVSVMTEIITAKIEQHPDVKDRLIKTGIRKIVENSPWDSFWGIGPSGDGTNMVGVIYMQLRDSLR